MKDAVEELRQNVSVPFERARAMPPSVYTSEDFLAHELRDIFAQDWFCVGRATALSKPGDYVTVELAGQAIIVLRNKEDQLRAMSRGGSVCLNRPRAFSKWFSASVTPPPLPASAG